MDEVVGSGHLGRGKERARGQEGGRDFVSSSSSLAITSSLQNKDLSYHSQHFFQYGRFCTIEVK